MLSWMPGMFALLFIWGLGYCCSAFMKSLASTLKISLIILHPFKAIPTQKAALCSGLLLFDKRLGDDGHMKAMASHIVGILLVYCTDLGRGPWEHHCKDKKLSVLEVVWEFMMERSRNHFMKSRPNGRHGPVILSSSQQRGNGLAWMMPGSPCSLVRDLPLS